MVNLKKSYLAVIGLAAFVIASNTFALEDGPKGSPAFARVQILRRGINLSEWFAQVHDRRGYTKEHFETWYTVDDIDLIKSMGFDHVRLSVNPEPMFSDRQPQKLPADYVGYLDAAVKMILDHGLAIVIDMHPESDFNAA